uniref:Integrator complex subunit 5 C-terminal domain-containing protein n=1 Tax=Romanomermis culicivorax TaxID=13658 RepID=A0A915KTZ4_ROMCU
MADAANRLKKNRKKQLLKRKNAAAGIKSLEEKKRDQEKRLANLSLIEEHALTLLHSQSSAAFSEMFCKVFFHSLLFNERYKIVLSRRQSPELSLQEPSCSSLPLLIEDPYLGDNYIAPTKLVHSGKLRQLNKPSRASAIDEMKKRRLVNFVDRFCREQKVLDNVSKNDAKDGNSRSYDIEFCRQLSIKLNDYVCHDAIAAEHSWDEWEYTKMNVERFLTTAKRIEELPFSWDLLLIASRGYPALWYSLPLLRSTLASVMVQLEAAIDKKAKISIEINSVLHRWFTVAREGKILADPLVRLYEVIQKVSNYEAFLILLQIWKYFQY